MPSLALDDLRAIENILREDAKCNRVTISSSEYEYDSVSDIEASGSVTSEFHLKGYKPNISIDLEPDGAVIYTSVDDAILVGVVEKMSRLLHPRERRVLSEISESGAIVSGLLGGTGAFILGWMLKMGNMQNVGYPLILILIAAILFRASYVFKFHKYSRIVLSNRKNIPHFFSRNRDAIIMAFITTLFAALIYFLVGRID